MPILTIPQRQAHAAETRRRAIADVCAELAAAAPTLGGRFLLFGSAATGAIRWNSDIDLLLDFPDHPSTTAAWTAAEQACRRHDLPCDIIPLAWCSPPPSSPTCCRKPSR